MIIILKPHASEQEVQEISEKVIEQGYESRVIRGVENIVIAAVGDESLHRSLQFLEYFECVDHVLPIQKRYKLASREYHQEDSIVRIGDYKIGRGNHAIIAGPCTIESLEQARDVAKYLISCGIRIFQGGIYKPGMNPYDFRGLGKTGLQILRQIKSEFNMAVMTEVVGVKEVDQVAEVVDCIQIGSQNCQNYNLLEVVAKTGKPILLKRGVATTVEEWILSAEYLLVSGCPGVILCECGIRTFDPCGHGLLDLTGVLTARKETHLPILVDPVYVAGNVEFIMPLTKAAIAVGVDGLLIESHPLPMNALTHPAQQIQASDFHQFLTDLQPIMHVMNWGKK